MDTEESDIDEIINDIDEIDDIDDLENKIIIKKNEDDEDDDEEEDKIKEEIIDEYDELNTEYSINTNNNIKFIVHPNDRLTSEFLSKYEFNKIVGIRAQQISDGSIIHIDVSHLDNPKEMAEYELYNNKCPLSVERYIGNNKYEIWSTQELIKKHL